MFDSFKGNKAVVLIMVAMAIFLIIIVYNSATTIDIDVFISGTNAIDSSIKRNNIDSSNVIVTDSDVLYHVGFDLTLYMPMHSSEDEYLKAVFIPSLLLFWPKKMWVNSNITLLFVLDDEQEKEHEYGDGLYKEYYNIIKDVTGMEFKILYEPKPDIKGMDGAHRQQYYMFIADKHTNSKWIGYIDSDALFQTIITPMNLFDIKLINGEIIVKPIIYAEMACNKGSNQYWNNAYWHTLRFYNNTFKEEPFRCMSYFPVIMPRDDVISIREYIEEVNGVSIEQVHQWHWKYMAQFNIFCIYQWHFRRNNYIFNVAGPYDMGDKCSFLQPKWEEIARTQHIETLDLNAKAMMMNHAKVMRFWTKFNYFTNITQYVQPLIKHFNGLRQMSQHIETAMLVGYCFNIKFNDNICHKCDLNQLQLNPYLYAFERHVTRLFDPTIMDSFKIYLQNNDKYMDLFGHDWNMTIINNFGIFKQIPCLH